VLIFVFAVVILLIAAGVLSAPLFTQRLEPYLPAKPPADRGAVDRILEALSELDQSKQLGKITEADYAVQRERLEVEYVRVTEGPT
jgi:hypothetical protein